MGLSDTPSTTPRILDVQDPESGHYVVLVSMPTQLANKWPDKPWGTPIAEIGLTKKDYERFPDHVLVDIDPASAGSQDLIWVFQKLDGPEWTTKSIGSESLIPARHRRQVTVTQTRQEVFPETLPSAIEGGITSSVVQQKDDTGKALKVNTEESIDLDGDSLLGQLTDTWGINTTEERLVIEGSAVTSGFGVKNARVSPLGNGLSVEDIERFPADEAEGDGIIYTLRERRVDDKTGIVLLYEKSLIDASRDTEIADAATADGWYPEIQAIDKWHSIMVKAKALTPLPDPQTWTEGGTFSLPNVLTEVGVVWDSDIRKDPSSSGTDDETFIEDNDISWTVEAEATVAGNVSGRPYTKVSAGARGTAEVTVVRTFSLGPPVDAVTTHTFNEVYGMLLIKGQQATQSGRGSQSGIGANRTVHSGALRNHVDNNLVVHDFGPVLHSGSLVIQNLGDPSTLTDSVAATSGTLPGSGSFPLVNVGVTVTGSVSLQLPASGPILTTGDTYVSDVRTREWGFGIWIRETYTITIP